MHWLILGILVIWLFLTPIEAWIERHALNRVEGSGWDTSFEPQCAWGKIIPRWHGAETLRYFYLRLPSFKYVISPQYIDERYEWQQLVIFWLSSRGWSAQWWRVDVK